MRKKTKSAAKAKARKPISSSAMRDLELMDPGAKKVRGGAISRRPGKKQRSN